MRIAAPILAVTALCCAVCAADAVKRGRDEGTLSVPTSNVTGSSNVSAYVSTSAAFGLAGGRFDPALGGEAGVGGILQLSGQVIPVASRGIGPTEAHLQVTTPGNDRLRLVGVALRADLYLSTAIDTFSFTSDTSKPDFNPYLSASLLADVDWLAKWKRVPLKTYFMLGMVDNPLVLNRYDQIVLRYGAEWKMYRNSVFVDGGTGFYREKRHRHNAVQDPGYEQISSWVEPGGRYRLLDRFSLVGGVRLCIAQKVKPKTPLQPDLFGVSLRLEAPLFFRETNTEAIRTLVFVEQQKQRAQADSLSAQSLAAQNEYFGKFNLSTDGLIDKTGSGDAASEKEQLVKERQEIQDKMDEIEKLLGEIDKE